MCNWTKGHRAPLQTGSEFSSINVCEWFLTYTAGQTELLTENHGGKNSSGASAGPNRKKIELARTHVKKKWWQHHQTGATVDTTRPQRRRATKEYVEKRSGERNVDSRIEVQLEEDGGGSTRQSWMATSGLWPIWNTQTRNYVDLNKQWAFGCPLQCSKWKFLKPSERIRIYDWPSVALRLLVG